MSMFLGQHKAIAICLKTEEKHLSRPNRKTFAISLKIVFISQDVLFMDAPGHKTVARKQMSSTEDKNKVLPRRLTQFIKVSSIDIWVTRHLINRVLRYVRTGGTVSVVHPFVEEPSLVKFATLPSQMLSRCMDMNCRGNINHKRSSLVG